MSTGSIGGSPQITPGPTSGLGVTNHGLTQEVVMQLLISAMQSQIPGMISDLNTEIDNLTQKIAMQNKSYQNLLKAGLPDAAADLKDAIDQEQQVLLDKMDDAMTLTSIKNRLGDTDPTNDEQAMQDFETYLDEHPNENNNL